jgi:hypothetical protein
MQPANSIVGAIKIFRDSLIEFIPLIGGVRVIDHGRGSKTANPADCRHASGYLGYPPQRCQVPWHPGCSDVEPTQTTTGGKMDTRCARARANRARVKLTLHNGAGVRQYRELGAFVRYCVARIERDLGETACWSVTIAPSGGEFASRVAIESAADNLESTGLGLDGPLAAWDALCKLEQLLREARARRVADAALDASDAARRHLEALDSGGPS